MWSFIGEMGGAIGDLAARLVDPGEGGQGLIRRQAVQQVAGDNRRIQPAAQQSARAVEARHGSRDSLGQQGLRRLDIVLIAREPQFRQSGGVIGLGPALTVAGRRDDNAGLQCLDTVIPSARRVEGGGVEVHGQPFFVEPGRQAQRDQRAGRAGGGNSPGGTVVVQRGRGQGTARQPDFARFRTVDDCAIAADNVQIGFVLPVPDRVTIDRGRILRRHAQPGGDFVQIIEPASEQHRVAAREDGRNR